MGRTVVRVPSPLPDGEPAPADGRLPEEAWRRQQGRRFGVYVHVPFCASRCGYCDFNTYTAQELSGEVGRDNYVEVLGAEFEVAGRVAAGAFPSAETVFVGGGTPTLLPASQLGRIVELADKAFGLASDAEVTAEANPESLTPDYLRQLRAAGFTRLSLGMQSNASHVLSVLDRRHTPGRALQAAQWAREAGFAHVSLDLIYGAPGERAEDFADSLDAAVASGVDHVSAYSLIVEAGTALAGRVKRGQLPAPDDDVAAERYLAAEEILSRGGLTWYEVSNWARGEEAQCRHNLLYWRGHSWWGFGPGAHSHVGGVRWWNVKHPVRYGQLLHSGSSPAAGRELLSDSERHTEEVMLRTRLREGLPLTLLDESGSFSARRAVADGRLDSEAFARGDLRLTLRGRLLADAVIRELLL